MCDKLIFIRILLILLFTRYGSPYDKYYCHPMIGWIILLPGGPRTIFCTQVFEEPFLRLITLKNHLIFNET